MDDGIHDDHDDFGGLHRDLTRVVDRRRALLLMGGGLGTVALAACGSSLTSKSSSTTSTSAMAGGATTTLASGSSSTTCAKLPTETAGPYPADGTNGPDVLNQTGVVRRDLTTSFGSMSGSVTGVPLTMKFKMLDIAKGCTPYAGVAMYAWHCDANGAYSLYTQGATNQNWLRGVQAADSDGWVTFTTIFPGCYAGRWPHVHFEVYPSLDRATNVKNRIATSQLALPQDACESVYASSGYPSSKRNLSQLSLRSDNVFSDGWTTQLGTVTGDVNSGMTVTLNVPV